MDTLIATSPWHIEWSTLATYAGLWLFFVAHIVAAFFLIRMRLLAEQH